MVYSISWTNPLFLLLAAVLVAVHGYRHIPVDEETAVLGFRFGDDTNVKKEPSKNLMWIGPRFGRRKRSEEENNLNEIEKNKGALVELLQESPWAFLALKSGKRRTVNFIPRLGRNSEEEYVENTMDSTFGKGNSGSGSQDTGPFFTPRLGRYATLFNREHL